MTSTQKLLFLNISNPSNKSANPELQKRIRSHLATLQHQRRQVSDSIWIADSRTPPEISDGSPESFEDADLRADASDAQSGSEDGEALQSCLTCRTKTNLLELQEDQGGQECLPYYPSPDSEETDLDDADLDTDVEIIRRIPPVQHARQVKDSSRPLPSDLPEGLVTLQRYLGDPTDTLGMHLIEGFGHSVSDTQACYEYLVDVQGPIFEEQCGMPKGFLRPRLVPLLNDVTFISTVALLCTPFLQAARRQTFDVHTEHILRLRLFVVSILQTAIQDPASVMKDSLLLSIAALAAFEALVGSSESCRVHMKGIVDIVKLRGGLGSLGLDGMPEHLLMWYDVNIAALLGYEPVTDALPRSGRFITPTPAVEDFVPFKYFQ